MRSEVKRLLVPAPQLTVITSTARRYFSSSPLVATRNSRMAALGRDTRQRDVIVPEPAGGVNGGADHETSETKSGIEIAEVPLRRSG